MSVEIARHCFTVAEYNRMAETGILSEDDRVELIEGEIVEMSPIGSRHAACIDLLVRVFRQVEDFAIIRVQSPIQLDAHSQPQPDIALLKPRADFYRHAHPTPADVLLVVEVADTTVDYDSQIKLPLYARAGVPEVWLVNLSKERIDSYAQPARGAYEVAVRAGRGETIAAQNVLGLILVVDDVFGS